MNNLAKIEQCNIKVIDYYLFLGHVLLLLFFAIYYYNSEIVVNDYYIILHYYYPIPDPHGPRQGFTPSPRGVR